MQLEYEAYAGMALKQLKEICSDVRAKWRVCKTAVTHRIGYEYIYARTFGDM